MKKLLPLIAFVFILSACGGYSEGTLHKENGGKFENNADYCTVFADECEFRECVNTGTSPYDGICYSEEPTDTDNFFIASYIRCDDGKLHDLVSRIDRDNNSEIFCYSDGCAHESDDCAACLERVFTADKKVYSAEYDYENGGVTFVASDAMTKTVVGGDELLNYDDASDIVTDGKNLFYFAADGRRIEYRKFCIETGESEWVKTFYSESGKVSVTYDDGSEVQGQIKKNGLRTEYIAPDGSYMVFSAEFAAEEHAAYRLYGLWNLNDDTITYLDAFAYAQYCEFYFVNDTLFCRNLDNKITYRTLTDAEWREIPQATEILQDRRIAGNYCIDGKLVINLMSETAGEKNTALVIDAVDLSVTTLTLKFAGYGSMYYRAPDIFGVTENDVIIATRNDGAGNVTLARMFKADYFESNSVYTEIGAFRLL